VFEAFGASQNKSNIHISISFLPFNMSRPELTGHASQFYNEKEAKKYDSSSRMIGIQREITERAIELLRLPTDKPSFLLDIGCGSGLSGEVLEEKGHVWVGCDVSRDMLDVANERFARKREMSSPSDDNMQDDDDDDDSNDADHDIPSTGDLMHHVSCLSKLNDEILDFIQKVLNLLN
jgi:SAM-dependent methyltransferase